MAEALHRLALLNLRRVASRAGVPLEEYQRHKAAGEHWCSRCRAWHLAADYVLSRCLCRACRTETDRRRHRCPLCGAPARSRCPDCILWVASYRRATAALFAAESRTGLPPEEMERRIQRLQARAVARRPLFPKET